MLKVMISDDPNSNAFPMENVVLSKTDANPFTPALVALKVVSFPFMGCGDFDSAPKLSRDRNAPGDENASVFLVSARPILAFFFM